MRLLFYVHALAGGGAERVMARLASGYARRGHEVTLVLESRENAWARTIDPSIETIVLPTTPIIETLALALLIFRRAPDATISAIAGANLKHAVAATLAGRRRRAILTYHGFYENEPQLINRLGFLTLSVLSRLCASTVVVSNALRDHVVSRFRADPARVVTIANPAAPDATPEPIDAATLKARPPAIVAIGRLVPDKAYLLLIRAFARLPRDATLFILGEGPERDALLAEARRLGVADRLSLPGFVADADAYLRRARCFALTSHYETFSLALIEALAHGLPAVATMSGGPAEIINDRALGELAAPGDVDAIASALARALDNPGDPAPRIARAAQFSLDAALDRYEALIGSAAGGAATVAADASPWRREGKSRNRNVSSTTKCAS